MGARAACVAGSCDDAVLVTARAAGGGSIGSQRRGRGPAGDIVRCRTRCRAARWCGITRITEPGAARDSPRRERRVRTSDHGSTDDVSTISFHVKHRCGTDTRRRAARCLRSPMARPASSGLRHRLRRRRSHGRGSSSCARRGLRSHGSEEGARVIGWWQQRGFVDGAGSRPPRWAIRTRAITSGAQKHALGASVT